jgi:hypothetical protein
MPRQHELDSFWGYVSGARLNPHGHPLSPNFVVLANVEAFLWLHYGVEVGLFQETEAQTIVLAEMIRAGRWSGSVKGAGLSDQFPPRLRSFLEDAQQYVGLEDDLAAARLLGLRYADTLARDLVNPIAFKMLFDEIAQACDNSELALFSDLITFSPESEWHRVLAGGIDPNRMIDGTGGTCEHLCSGYFAAMNHIGALDELIYLCAEESETDRRQDFQTDYTLSLLYDRVRSMHLWRLNLREPSVRRRFEGLTYMIGNLLSSDRELASMQFDSAEFLSRVEFLCTNWLGDSTVRLLQSPAA